MRWIRAVFDGTGIIAAVGTAFLALGVLFAALILASPNGWQWLGGQAVNAQERTGLVEYTYHGQTYDFDDTVSLRTGSRRIWINPSDPIQATLHIGVARLSDSLFVAVPVVIGAGMVATGFLRRHQRGRHHRDATGSADASYGYGIDPLTVAQFVTGRRQTGK